MADQLEFDPAAAVELAADYERSGQTERADQLWDAISQHTAYDCEFRAQYAAVMFQARQQRYPRGSVLRSRFLLQLMAASCPTPQLVDAYFENFEQLFRNQPPRSQPGRVTLGTGSGRCGSTTLAAAFAGLGDVCATHENPPKIYWEPRPEQVAFHFERFRRLTRYCDVVFDAAHWWLRVLEPFFAEFPSGKVVGLVRDTSTCVASFLKFQGRGESSTNHWAPPHSGLWQPSVWDPAYPSYPLPANLAAQRDADAIKVAMVTRYVTQYNQTLCSLAEQNDQRMLVIATEAMNDPATEDRLSAFVGARVRMPSAPLNVGNNLEGAQPDRWL